MNRNIKIISAAIVLIFGIIIYFSALQEVSEPQEISCAAGRAETAVQLPLNSEEVNACLFRYYKAVYTLVEEGNDVAFVARDMKTGEELSFQGNKLFYSASTIKGPYVVSLIEDNPKILIESSFSVEEAIRISSNEEYKNLRELYGDESFHAWLKESGCIGMDYEDNYIDLTAEQLADMWEYCYEYFFVNGNRMAKSCRQLFEYALNSPISEALGEENTVYSKAGWIAMEEERYQVQNDAGIVMDGENGYVMVILSDACGKNSELEELASALDLLYEEMVK